ncbi:hypothetical protein JCM19240_5020 [Vibrio maritimus]|uniref:Uncharacterized protein n=1 Tax=Vibrio maritimus TaxID=990268 RepID=A0A090SYP2_9VIBR|nr:hypothetical protein JCM19240_5020 [Vibrio maritimus]
MIDTKYLLQEVERNLLENRNLFDAHQLKMARSGTLKPLQIQIQDIDTQEARICHILNMVNQVNIRYRERNSTILNHACDAILKELAAAKFA